MCKSGAQFNSSSSDYSGKLTPHLQLKTINTSFIKLLNKLFNISYTHTPPPGKLTPHLQLKMINTSFIKLLNKLFNISNMSTHPPPHQVNSVWRITKTTGPGLKIELDEKVVLEILVLGGLCADFPDAWLEFWSRRVVKIMFLDTDTASLEFSAMPGSMRICF